MTDMATYYLFGSQAFISYSADSGHWTERGLIYTVTPETLLLDGQWHW
jgi:hypothetical protein